LEKNIFFGGRVYFFLEGDGGIFQGWGQSGGREAEGLGNAPEIGGGWVVFRTFASLSI